MRTCVHACVFVHACMCTCACVFTSADGKPTAFSVVSSRARHRFDFTGTGRHNEQALVSL